MIDCSYKLEHYGKRIAVVVSIRQSFY